MLNCPQNPPSDQARQNCTQMQRLGKKTNVLNKAIPLGSKVGYADYPMHINVGDLLIFLGAINFFKWNKNPLPVSFCLFDASKKAFDALGDVEVIACHGGGNFGDIYPHHQTLRENIILAFPDKPIVIMPQSFHFASDEAMRKSARIFSTHDNVTLYVRDQPSFNIARKYFSDQVFLSPDMAHRLYDGFETIRHHGTTEPISDHKEFHLTRRDVEAVDTIETQNLPSHDWKDTMSFSEKLCIERHRSAAKICGLINRPNPKILLSYHRTIEHVISSIARRIVRHNPWVTSRLHGAIFGLLLNRDVKLHDNSYGKNSRYFSLWGPDLVALK